MCVQSHGLDMQSPYVFNTKADALNMFICNTNNKVTNIVTSMLFTHKTCELQNSQSGSTIKK